MRRPQNRYAILLLFLAGLAACLTVSCVSKKQALEDAPIITSATYQHTQYNGRNQPVEASAAKEGGSAFIVTYFRSEEEREHGLYGSAEPPAEVGDYYVRIERPEGNGFRRGNPIDVEYHIQKAFIAIVAEPVQRFPYDGTPKAAEVLTDPPADPPPVMTYTAWDDTTTPPSSDPPRNRGRYCVTIVFPGNERYMGASKELELWIE
jgi:hypothetical protein